MFSVFTSTLYSSQTQTLVLSMTKSNVLWVTVRIWLDFPPSSSATFTVPPYHPPLSQAHIPITYWITASFPSKHLWGSTSVNFLHMGILSRALFIILLKRIALLKCILLLDSFGLSSACMETLGTLNCFSSPVLSIISILRTHVPNNASLVSEQVNSLFSQQTVLYFIF